MGDGRDNPFRISKVEAPRRLTSRAWDTLLYETDGLWRTGNKI